jgi:hypothetical protein
MQNETNNKEYEKLVLMYMEGSNYDFSGVKVTIKSLQEYYDGRITVIVNGVDHKLLNFLESCKVNIEKSENYTVLFKTSPYNNKIIYIHMFLQRYRDILKNCHILYTDITDVYFKANPFELFRKNLIWAGSEDLTFEHCETNKAWCMICYGFEVFARIKHQKVINSGLLMGMYDDIQHLYELMISDMSKILSRVNYPITDQMIFNKLVYIDDLQCVLDHTNVNNMAQGIKLSADNMINHQYKVVETIKNELYKKYE